MKLILFDMMDTLVVDNFPRAFLWLLEKKNLTFHEFQSHRNIQSYLDFELGEIGDFEFFRDYYRVGLQDDLKQRLPAPQKIKQQLYKQIKLMYGVSELLQWLNSIQKHDSQLKLGIASNYSTWYSIILKKLKTLESSMDYLFFSCEMNVRKPDQKYYQIIQDSLSQSREHKHIEVLFIDDKKQNLYWPQKMGWHICLANTGNNLKSVIEDFLSVH